MSSDRMQDLAGSRISETEIYNTYIQTSGVSGYRNKMQDIDATRIRANGRGKAVAMRLQELPSLDIHSKKSRKAHPNDM